MIVFKYGSNAKNVATQWMWQCNSLNQEKNWDGVAIKKSNQGVMQWLRPLEIIHSKKSGTNTTECGVADTMWETEIASIGQGACGKIYEKMIHEHLSNFYVLQTHNTFYYKVMFYNHYRKN